MYIPPHFKQDDWASATQLMAEYSFAQLITVTDEAGLEISHIPVLYDEAEHQLVFHLAAVNEHNQGLTAHPVTVIFNGPHGYISPNWADKLLVPTWNYSAVHITGQVSEVVSPPEKLAAMTQMADFYESRLTPAWSLSELNDKQQQGMLKAIRCYSLQIDSWQAKHKLSQDKTAQTVAQITEKLQGSVADSIQAYPFQDNHALAKMMLKG
ncbi:MAG: transcriptional regulator [Oceanospirillaceae bacterium]|jgi:transcriptional regulator